MTPFRGHLLADAAMLTRYAENLEQKRSPQNEGLWAYFCKPEIERARRVAEQLRASAS